MTTAKTKEVAMKRFYRALAAYKGQFKVAIGGRIRMTKGTEAPNGYAGYTSTYCPLEGAGSVNPGQYALGASKFGLAGDQIEHIIGAADGRCMMHKYRRVRAKMLKVLGLTEY